jgi:uncharacterized protein YndB with AHSA1/START domain
MAMRAALAALGALLAAAASAEPSGVSPSGFVVTHRLEVKAPPARVFEAIGRIERWWTDEHTYSGQAANMRLDLVAGGCFCERWTGGSIMHAQVLYVADGKVVRMQGGLGPLQALAVNGVYTLAVSQVDGRTVLTSTYRVAGTPDAALDQWASKVDDVLGEQARRLVSFVESGRPAP